MLEYRELNYTISLNQYVKGWVIEFSDWSEWDLVSITRNLDYFVCFRTVNALLYGGQ